MSFKDAEPAEWKSWGKSLIGHRSGRLLVTAYYGREPGSSGPVHYWRCRCDCGSEVFCISQNIRTGNSQSCGCLKNERTGNRSRTHGLSGSHEFTVWVLMRDRCKNPNNKSFQNYGGRGIRVCERWDTSFEAFYEDMGSRPSSRHSIDRIENEGDYEPSNCRWATPEEQGANKRSNVIVEWQGERMILAEAIRRSDVPPKIAENRLRRGWSLERALTTKLWAAGQARKPVTTKADGVYVYVDGERLLLKAACRRLGLKYGTVHSRIMRGVSPQSALRLQTG